MNDMTHFIFDFRNIAESMFKYNDVMFSPKINLKKLNGLLQDFYFQ